MTPEQVEAAAERMQAGIIAEVLTQAHLGIAELSSGEGLPADFMEGLEAGLKSSVGLTMAALSARGFLDARAIDEAMRE